MKKLLLIAILLFATGNLFAQTDGMSYQAVIINPSTQEIPGADVNGNIFPNKSLTVRFTITNSGGGIDYQEVHTTSTDAYGMINLMIGHGKPFSGVFNEIVWDGTQKDLKVEINLDGSYANLSTQPLLFIPYAYHRDITATGDLLVEGSIHFSGSLDVEGITNLNNSFKVNKSSPSNLTGTLQVDGKATFNEEVTVANESPANLTGVLTVNGKTLIDNDLEVTGISTLGGIGVKNMTIESDEEEFVATFENTNTGNGDGIKIKLGKEKVNNFAPTMPGLPSQDQINQVKNLISSNFTGSKITILQDIVKEGVKDDIETIAGLSVGIGNHLINFINDKIISHAYLPELAVPKIDFPYLATPTIPINPPNLPTFTVPSREITPGITLLNFTLLGVDKSVKLPALNTPKINFNPPNIPNFNIPSTTITNGFTLLKKTTLLPITKILPDIPEIDLTAIGINGLDILSEDFWGIPSIELEDIVTNPLNNKNEFISFTDSSDSQLGSIRAESISDWSNNFLNPIYIYKLYGALNSAVDKKHAKYHFKSKIYEALFDYEKIGVEYSSGNGDYAEWLERINPNENISTGDIVAVKAGKITKDLTNAEQVMAVSHRPIVLGNTPDQSKIHLGNNIAFMGQIPVKVMGPVQSGDYIVAKGNIAGYGLAIPPTKMQLEDFKLAVGRAWDTDRANGAKMINTVVGVHNGDYLNILKSYERKFIESEARLQSVEAKLEVLTEIVTKKQKSI